MTKANVYILAIESSCDDTSAAVLENDKVLSNVVANQEVHKQYGGIVERETYEKMVGKTLEMLKEALPIDGLFFDIHGAMSVQGLEDPEGDLIVRIREVIGNDVLVSSCMDLHGSVSPRLAQNIDMITCYRLAPHEDAMISKKRALTNLLFIKNGRNHNLQLP
nr:M81 family metallopeptidase [Capnocytophaga stomatis]